MSAIVPAIGIPAGFKAVLIGALLSAAIPVPGADIAPAREPVAALTPGGPGGEKAEANRAALIEGGYEALLLRVHLIRQVRRSIEVQTFIWTNDECGRLIMFELLEAARRGVKVRIVADHLFSDQDPGTVAFLATASPNLEIRHYRPASARLKPSRLQLLLAGLRSFRSVNQRMHNKVMVFDDHVLLTGGRNIENSYFDHATGLNYRDRDVLVAGPAAREAAASFEEYWNYGHVIPSRELADVAAAIARDDFPRYPRREDWDFGGLFSDIQREAADAALLSRRLGARLRPVDRAVFIADSPGKGRGFFSTTARITRELRGTLESARERITIQTPYLVLSGPAQRLIRDMRARTPALAIRVSTNSFASTDNLPAYSANYRLRGNYIEQLGLEVREFKPQPADRSRLFPQYERMAARARERHGAGGERPFLSLHAKSLAIDDRVAFVGSYNLDPRSENLNCEAGLLVEDAAFARELRAVIDRDLRPENSWVIARRRLPLRLDAVNALVDGILSLSPLDVWPLQNTSSFELEEGREEVAPGDSRFYEHYRDVGSFPGAEGPLTTKEILTRIYKAVGTPLTPVL